MKEAFFVESLNIKIVPLVDMVDGKSGVRYITMDSSFVDGECPKEVLLTERRCKHHIVRAHEFRNLKNEEDMFALNVGLAEPEYEQIYIAVSDEVQKYLQLPIDILSEQLDGANKANSHLNAVVSKIADEKIYLQATIDEQHYFIENVGFWRRFKFLFTRKF